MSVIYKDLTKEQKAFICNGCGGKGGWIKPPNFIFSKPCGEHDFDYWLGCDDEHKKKADESFYKRMKVKISQAKWYKKPHYHIWAYTYYKAVRIGGKKYFYYSNTQKTYTDLKLEMMR